MDDALEHQKKSSQLASAFIKDHPHSGIKTPGDLYKHMRNNPGEIETWIQNRTDVPIEHRTIQELASSFQAAESLAHFQAAPHPQTTTPNKEAVGIAGTLFAGFAPLLPDSTVKLAEHAYSQAAPNVNLYDFIPTEIREDKEFQAELTQLKDSATEDIRRQHLGRHLNNKQIEERLGELHRDFSKEAFEKFNNSADHAERIRAAREKDIYLKDAHGRVIGERVFRDKKGKVNPALDPIYLSYQTQKRAAVRKALERRKEDIKNGEKPQFNEEQLRTVTELEYDNHFAALFPEKASAYAKQDSRMSYSMKAMRKAEKRIQKREAKKVKTTQPKKASELQREWNGQKIAQAVLKGYDPFGLFKKMRDMKVWQTRPWRSMRLGPESTSASNNPAQDKTIIDAPKVNTPPGGGLMQNMVFASSSPGSSSAWGGYQKQNSTGESIIWNRFFSSPASSLNKRLGRSIGNKIVGKTASTVAKNVGQKIAGEAAKKLVQKGAQQAATALLGNPISLTVIGIILLVLLVVMMIIVTLIKAGEGSDSTGLGAGSSAPGTGPGGPGNSNPIPGFTLSKTVDKSTSTYPEPITYTLTYTYTPAAGASIQLADITVYDKLPDNVTYVESTGVTLFDSSTRTVSWKLSDPANVSPLKVTVTPNQDNIVIRNSAYATSSAPSSGSPGPGPSSSNCNGYYTASRALNNPIGNFGDPNCNFATDETAAKNQLYAQLKSLDPDEADYWFITVVPCESVPSYNPNSHSEQAAIGSPDAAGVWGLFSMGRGKNGSYDHGDVDWGTQVSNAISYANMLRRNGIPLGGSQGGYWDCWKK